LSPVEPPLLFDLLNTHLQLLYGPSEIQLILFLNYPTASAYITNEETPFAGLIMLGQL
jgi:hypothetical protein